MRLFSIGKVDFVVDVRRMFALGVDFGDDETFWIVIGFVAFGVLWYDPPTTEQIAEYNRMRRIIDKETD